MNTFDAIYGRRSIRRFKPINIAEEAIDKIISAGIQAPSGMNRQPWKFVILEAAKKDQLISVMSKRASLMKKIKINTEGYEATIKSMAQAPVIILVFNTGFQPKLFPMPFYRFFRLLDIQSIGGAIQTMLLAAHDLGLGTLWICNIFHAEKQLKAFLGKKDELIAAIALGHADEDPDARPRKDIANIVEWLK